MWPVMKRESLVSRRHVLRNIAVRNDATKHSLPGVAMTVDESWNYDHIRRIDDLARRLEICPYRCDLLSLDQHITLGEIADLRWSMLRIVPPFSRIRRLGSGRETRST